VTVTLPSHSSRQGPTGQEATSSVAPTRRVPRILERHLSRPGLAVAGLFLAASLFPSLLPRPGWAQGVITGITVAIGYGFGTAGAALWRYLQIPTLRGRWRSMVLWILVGFVAISAALEVWRYVGWQNEQRALFGMPALGIGDWPVIVLLGALVFGLLVVLARLLRRFTRAVIRLLRRFMPPRLAIVLGVTGVAALLLLIYSGALVQLFFGIANAIYSPRDGDNKPGVTTAPVSQLRTGGPDSLVAWSTLGREGRSFVVKGPTVLQLEGASPGTAAMEPIRVYAGLRSAPTADERAALVLRELQRTGAFEREVLVLATTTGSGFLQPEGVDPLEYLWHGDTAIAGMQYSYLPSWLSLLADQSNAQISSEALFDTVYSYWKTLPQDARPRLYLYGLSLGSFGAEAVLGSVQLLNQPIDGALLVGPPFVNPLHERLTVGRDPGTPAWRPVYQQGATVRFTNQKPTLLSGLGQSAEWGATRLGYVQNGSDPVVFFSPSLFISEPDWLIGPRAADVSTRFTWFPLVSGWQVLFDLANAGGVPWGFGHLYQPNQNLEGWYAVTQPPDWTPQEISRLGQTLDRSAGE
jgi:uncharacterized membrane protein